MNNIKITCKNCGNQFVLTKYEFRNLLNAYSTNITSFDKQQLVIMVEKFRCTKCGAKNAIVREYPVEDVIYPNHKSIEHTCQDIGNETHQETCIYCGKVFTVLENIPRQKKRLCSQCLKVRNNAE